ncbi:MAG TPA: HD domain-containing phosphohydrolase [Candidatus Limnocylindrales bacterium]|nr:HD domain-containing phosphohydrolase [Candidatus Limnocylindrales bacterium]
MSVEPGLPGRAVTILVVDDDPDVRETIHDQLSLMGYHVVTAESGEAALIAAETSAPALVLTDVHMGAMSGIELCARLKRDPRFQLIPVIVLTAISDLTARVAGLEAGADDFFAKPVEFIELRTRIAALLKVKALIDQLERAEEVITTLALTIEARDPYTGGHCERLGRYAVALGRELGCDATMLKALRLGGYLHDLGKIAVPDGILLKPGRLDDGERERIKAHPLAGADLVRGLRTLDNVRPLILYHHERWDGSGYPEGLKGESIPLGARIMAAVDVYDALHTARPYKKPMTHDEAVTVLRREVEAGFWDPRVITFFIDVMKDVKHEGTDP